MNLRSLPCMLSHKLASYMLGGHICFSLAAAETETDFSQDKNFCQVPAGDYPDINQLWVRSFLASLFLPMNINHLATTAGTIQVFYFSISLFIPPFLNCPLSESPPTMDESHVCRVGARAHAERHPPTKSWPPSNPKCQMSATRRLDFWEIFEISRLASSFR